jgi:hypothetical protein
MVEVPNSMRPHQGLPEEYLWPLETRHNAALFRELQLIEIAFQRVQSTAVQDAGIIIESTSN